MYNNVLYANVLVPETFPLVFFGVKNLFQKLAESLMLNIKTRSPYTGSLQRRKVPFMKQHHSQTRASIKFSWHKPCYKSSITERWLLQLRKTWILEFLFSNVNTVKNKLASLVVGRSILSSSFKLIKHENSNFLTLKWLMMVNVNSPCSLWVVSSLKIIFDIFMKDIGRC